MQGEIHVAVIANYPVLDVTGRARPSRHVFIALYYMPSAVIANYPVFRSDGKSTAVGQAVMFLSLHIIRPLQHVTQILFWYRKFLWMFSGLFL